MLTNSSSSGGPYSGSVTGDQTYATGIADTGGIALLNSSSVIVDQVGMSSGTLYKEGTSLASLGTTNTNTGYARLLNGAKDTDNNSADFVQVTPSDPQNSSSALTPVNCVAMMGVESVAYTIIPAVDLYAPLENGSPKELYRPQTDIVTPTIFSVQPISQIKQVGDVFTVTVNLSDVVSLGAFDFYLSYNGAVLTPTAITLLNPISSTGRTPLLVASEISGTGQYVHLAVATLGLTTTAGVSGNVPLAQITFVALAAGQSNLTFMPAAPEAYAVGPCPEMVSDVSGAVLILPATPTAIELAGFGATPVSAAKCGNASGAECVSVWWQTMHESDTAGFALLRARGQGGVAGAFNTASLITPFIQGQGSGGGSYLWQDKDTQPGATYSYWLQEIRLDGTVSEYGPITLMVDGSVGGGP